MVVVQQHDLLYVLVLASAGSCECCKWGWDEEEVFRHAVLALFYEVLVLLSKPQPILSLTEKLHASGDLLS